MAIKLSSLTSVARKHSSKQSLADWAYARIRDSIRSGAYRPGERLFEVEIAKKLNISRTPIREALQRLESDGLIAHEGRRGLIVLQLDLQMLLELYAIRETLEGTAARLAARHASDEEIIILQQLVALEEHLPDLAEKHEWHNLKFHQALYRGGRNRYLLRILNLMHDVMMLTCPCRKLRSDSIGDVIHRG